MASSIWRAKVRTAEIFVDLLPVKSLLCGDMLVSSLPAPVQYRMHDALFPDTVLRYDKMVCLTTEVCHQIDIIS
jgi:hypothetical protein